MKRWIGIIIVGALLIGMVAWRLKGKSEATAAQALAIQARAKAAPLVSLSTVAVRDIGRSYAGIGSVESPFNVKISTKVTGRIEYLTKREGDAVKVGEVLVRIDPTQIEAQIAQAQSAVAEAEARLAQAKLAQNPNNVGIRTQIDQQKAGVTSTQADYNQVTQNYNAQVQAARSAVVDSQGKVDGAAAQINTARANISSAQASVNNSKSKLSRTLDLYKQGFVAAQDVDDAKTALQVAEGGLEVAQSQLQASNAGLDSARAQKVSAEKNLEIVITKGKADIAAAQAKLDQSKSGLTFAKSGDANIPAYTENLKALANAVDAARAQVRNLQSQLSDLVLTSSIDGFITSRLFDPGSTVTPGQTIFNVVDIKSLFVTVPVPEEAARRLVLGQIADVQFDAYPGRKFPAAITQLSPAADPASRQFPVRVTISNARGEIKPGMFAHVVFSTETIRHATVVPREAVIKTPTGPAVVKVDAEMVAHRVPVKVGADDTAQLQVFGDLHAGDQVITLSLTPVKDGTKIRVNPPSDAKKPQRRHVIHATGEFSE